jgi:hypothetical protein
MLSWSTWQIVVPQRTTALYIPEDIYHCIFAYIINGDVDRSLIFTLTRVCKFFAVIFMPVLLSSRSINLKLDHFPNALLHSDPIACSQILHVKRCTIFYQDVPIHSETSAARLLSIIRTLPNTLKSLSLKNVAITFDIFTAYSLTNLTSLAIDTVIISSKSTSLPSQSTVKLNLESFSLYNYVIDTTGDLHTSFILRSLASFINFDAIRTLRTDNRVFFDTITLLNQNKILPQIKELRCTINDFRKFLLFLAHVPNLTTLSIDVEYNEDLMKSIPSDASKLIPDLVTLRCPALLVPYLISGRPVTNIDVHGRLRVRRYVAPEPFELIQLIRLSSAPIKVLHLSVNIYLDCACLLGDAFPELEELDMNVGTLTCNTHNVRLPYSFHFNQSFMCFPTVFRGSVRYSKRDQVQRGAAAAVHHDQPPIPSLRRPHHAVQLGIRPPGTIKDGYTPPGCFPFAHERRFPPSG